MAAIKLKTAVPGPKSKEILTRRQRLVAAGVAVGRIPICATEAQGALLTDVDGNTFIDFTGGIGCMNAGHSAEKVVSAVQKQAARLQHTCFQVTMYEPYIDLCEKLIEITPGTFPKKACLFNSGAEAVENAVKIARRVTGRAAVLCFDHGFHGRTLLGLSLTSKVKPYKDGFGPFAPEIYRAGMPYEYYRPASMSADEYVESCITDFKRVLKSAVTPDRLAAVIIEPVLGEGGFIVPPKAFLNAITEVCKANGIVLIADEIQSGFGRTGKMFASEHFGLEPDLITLAKSMSNGFPVSAVVGRAEMLDAVQAGGLGGTFGGNPVACVAALAAIQTIEEEKLCARSELVGRRMRETLESLAREVKCIGEVRGLGSMLALEIVRDRKPSKELADTVVSRCGEKGLLLLTAGLEGNVLRVLVPLCITDAQAEEAMQVLSGVISGL